ncbi:MAG: hypothetical protein SFY32_04005 [Bacteroidota bacterium]|nr:hypothetical protein [Bacteroidota bacterium]
MKIRSKYIITMPYPPISWFGALICIILLYACKTEVKKLEFDTQIEATVVDDNSAPLQGVNVGIYNDFSFYQIDIKQLNLLNALQSGQTDGSGKIAFTNLTEGASYWLAVYYNDTNKYKGIDLLYNNKSINNSLAVKPRKGSINYVRLKLEAFEGLVSFSADKSDSARLPLEITVNNTIVGVLSGTRTGPATSFNDNNVLTTAVSKGKFTYYIKSKDCAWSGINTISGAAWIPVHLPPCNGADLGFWSTDTTKAIYPISITLNETDALPNITGAILTSPTCNTTRTAGTYTYYAKAADNSCTWAGQITIKANQCTTINLPKCK